MTPKNKKQGPCGSFCFKYWLGSGCPDDCISDYKIKSAKCIGVDCGEYNDKK